MTCARLASGKLEISRGIQGCNFLARDIFETPVWVCDAAATGVSKTRPQPLGACQADIRFLTLNSRISSAPKRILFLYNSFGWSPVPFFMITPWCSRSLYREICD